MIELREISKTYQMGKVEVKALAGVSVSIKRGEFVAIMGPSGSGKSTLMHIMGLLDRPDTGTYALSGKPLTGLTEEQLAVIRNRLVGFIFQQFHLLPRLTALENAELPLLYAGRRHLKEKAREKLEIVGLSERMRHRPNELSGGQQQRVAIARSLVNDPLIILADEPTGNLDSKSKEEIIAILKQLNRQGKTVIVVTHEKEVAEHARRIISMRDGKIVSDQLQSGKTPSGRADSVEHADEDIVSGHSRLIARTKFLDYVREAGFAIVSHKLRAFLSILGILIGVAAVIAMLALGEGAKVSIQKQLASLGSNLLEIRPGSSRVRGVAFEAGTVARFTFQDVQAIRKLGDKIKRVSPTVSGRGQLVFENKNWNTRVEGVGVEYAEMRASVPVVGRFFTLEEVRIREKVAVLGLTVVRELFGEKNPVGQIIKLNLNNFKVIGILPEKGASGPRDQDDTVLVPVTTAMYRVFGKQYIDTISVEAARLEDLAPLQEEIKQMIIGQHRIRKNPDDAFTIRNMADIKTALESTTRTMSMLLGAIAAISLVVGGIGIMNIMLVSVTERTREIGLRKAIGANRKDIMIQFLIESVLMSFAGGICGIALGAGTAVLITRFAGWAVQITWFSVVLATTFSIMVGMVFGLWPAQQASQLDPIEALRYE